MTKPVLRGPNGNEFTLNVDGEHTVSIENELIIDTLTNALNELAATDFKVNLVTHTFDIAVKGMQDSDYPSQFHDKTNVTSHNDAYAYELKESAQNWGISSGFSGVAEIDVHYGGISETKTGVVRSVNISKIPSAENNADHWTGTIEFTTVEVLY